MPPPVITPLPTPPTRTNPANFSERADHFLSALPNFGNQMNSLAAYMDTASVGSIAAAEAARDAAQDARTGAETARDAAQDARTGAETARSQAQTARTGAETARSQAQTAAALANGLPVGTITYFAADAPPDGWLMCDGSPITALYPDLRALLIDAGSPYGTAGADPRIPDLRGEFVRGWDSGRGVDAGRGFGSAQGDAIRNITGTFDPAGRVSGASEADFTGPFTRGTASRTSHGNASSDSRVITFDASKVVPTASENRPRNVALLPCIRAYASVVNVPGQADLDNIAAAYVSRSQDTALSAGYTSNSRDLGVISSGTIPLSPTGGNFITYSNRGAHTLQAPVMAGDYTLVIAVEDGVGAGAITLSGFDRVIGDAFGAVAGNAYNVYVTKLGTRILANVVRIV